MATGICDSAYLITSIKHGPTPGAETELLFPTGFGVTETIEHLPIRAGTVLGPVCRPAITKDLTAWARNLDLDDVIAADTSGSLIITLKQADGDSTVITITTMKRGTVELEGTSAPYTKVTNFVHEGAMSSSPMSVTV